EGEADDVVADHALLTACARFARVGGGVRLAGLEGRETPLTIDQNDVARFIQLRDETPGPDASSPTVSGRSESTWTQDSPSGVAAFFGSWPGDETEAELLAALGDIG